MTNCDGGVFCQQHHRHGLAQNRAATHNHRMLAFDVDIVGLQRSHNALRRGAAIGRLTHSHTSKAKAGDAIHILAEVNSIKAGAFIDLCWHGVL